MMRLALVAFSLAILAGCGIQGGLERPPPMWNRAGAEHAEARWRAEHCGRQVLTREERERCSSAPASTSTTTATATEPSPNQPPSSATTPTTTPQ